ncbi:unnamed protein product [Ectocarpus sp. 8 AP-2014]
MAQLHVLAFSFYHGRGRGSSSVWLAWSQPSDHRPQSRLPPCRAADRFLLWVRMERRVLCVHGALYRLVVGAFHTFPSNDLCLNGVQKPHACLASSSLTQVSVCAAHGQVENSRWRIRPRQARGYIDACGLSFDDMLFIFGSRLATLVAFFVFLTCTSFSFRFHNFPRPFALESDMSQLWRFSLVSAFSFLGCVNFPAVVLFSWCHVSSSALWYLC